jgi:ATPase subunit of ABC transporter with duplicated ATPase domains
VECLETALADFPVALVVVSQDRPFLDRLTVRRWRLRPAAGGDWELLE